MFQNVFHISHKIIVTLIFMLNFFIGFQNTSVFADINEIQGKLSLMPSLVHSYQFDASFVAKENDPKRQAVTQNGKFFQSRSNFRVESIASAPQGTTIDPIAQNTIYAYNGTDYQWFIIGRETISFSKQPRHPSLYWLQNPIMIPFSWLVSQKSNWSELKDKKIWLKRFGDAKYEEDSKVVNGYPCEVVSFLDNEFEGGKIYVYFAKDIAYYPLRIKSVRGNSFIIIDVTKHALHSTNEGVVVFPLSISITTVEGAKEMLNLEWTIIDTSIQLNPKIDDDLFTISPASAKTVIDYDKELENLTVDNSSFSDLPSSKTLTLGRVLFIIVINCGIIALLVWSIRYHRS